jgi:hypothetical protein
MKPNRSRIFRRPQFALRTLVIGGLVLGASIGMYGPHLAKSVQAWLQPEPVQVQQPIFIWTAPVNTWDSATTGYYESAESPLR